MIDSCFSSLITKGDGLSSIPSPIATIVSSIMSCTTDIYETVTGLVSSIDWSTTTFAPWDLLTTRCLLNNMRPKSISSDSNSRSYDRKPSFGSTSSLLCFTNSRASSKDTLKRFIIYMITQVAERLRPIAQCTNTTFLFEDFLLKAST